MVKYEPYVCCPGKYGSQLDFIFGCLFGMLGIMLFIATVWLRWSIVDNNLIGLLLIPANIFILVAAAFFGELSKRKVVKEERLELV
jgi:hypothetical protein